jgi:hypothetical protein
MVHRRWSTLIGHMALLSRPRVPAERIERVHQGFRRRLDDAVEGVFQQACLGGDLETARELLGVMTAMHGRRQRDFGGERRIADDALRRAGQELLRREQSQGAGAAIPSSRSAPVGGR